MMVAVLVELVLIRTVRLPWLGNDIRTVVWKSQKPQLA